MLNFRWNPMDSFEKELAIYLERVGAQPGAMPPEDFAPQLARPMQPSPALASGTQVDGPWLVDTVLKQGLYETTQKVYLRLPEMQSEALLGPFVRKLIAKDAGVGSAYAFVMAAQREGAHLGHVPRVLSCTECGSALEVVMEWIDGRTLEQEVHAAGDPQARLALVERVFAELCDAVSELHEGMARPVIHRDLTPSNVLLAADGRLMLVDLGIARTWQQARQVDTTHFGTRGYAPPEQFGFGQTDTRSDVYALGELLRFCVMGLNPDEEPEDAFASSDAGSSRDAGPANAYAEVIQQATQLDPDKRFQNVQALKQAFLSVRAASATAADALFADKNMARARISRQTGVGAWLSRVPAWLGQMWNAVLSCSVVFVVASMVAVSMSDLPSIARGFEIVYYSMYWMVIVPVWLMWSYVLLDKRRLRQRFYVVYAWPSRRAARVAFVVTLVLALLWIILVMFAYV